MRTPDITELRCFEAALRTGSISAAGRELGVTQQAVSARLRGLERLIGVPLLERSPAGVSPTPGGDAVLAWAREVLAAAARLDEGISSLAGQPDRALTVGASQTVAAHLLPTWLLELRRAQLAAGSAPSEIALRTGNSTEIVAAVRAGELDLGFIESPAPPHGLGSAQVGRDRMVVAVAPDHEWSGRASVPLADLARVQLVAREVGSGTRAAFEAAVSEALGIEPLAPALTLATEAAVRSAVAQCVAPAVLSELTVRDDAQLGRIVALPIGPEPLERPFTAVWRGSRRDLTGVRRQLVALAGRHRHTEAPG
ncbi:LysR family transcriptional regulator [Leucobacter luti]|uniref:Molybdate transport repressor ModE-like protein n=1 Tax=Leucobacter luti TaxID=340320 RepID=A0A4Q7TPL5_9MICO|nr:LysR family transcriptional regulator [Leucobacter luti]RZT62735.1 molybdate transport repressor ModE-like protein [Leucobacter luti]